MIYREPQPLTRQELEVYIENQDEALGEKILGYILHAQDSNEALQLLADDRIWSSNVEATRGIAVLCVGHLARLFQSIDPTMVRTIMGYGKMDPAPRVQCNYNDALSDLSVFAPRIAKAIRNDCAQ